MKKQKKLIIALTILLMFFIVNVKELVFANEEKDFGKLFEEVEYTEDFNNWLKMSDEEKSEVLIPRIYEVDSPTTESNNPFFKAKLVGASLNSKYSLKDNIPNNLSIRNQQNTQLCWCIAALSSLETNIALTNYKNGANTSNVYDYSERHMEYMSSKNFANNVQNEKGYNRKVGSGGFWIFAETYLVNGYGAIDESEMPFENNEDTIEISGIQDKTVKTQVYDTIRFPSYNAQTGEEKEKTINSIKEHIQNYGSVYTHIYGATPVSDNGYNSTTGALYCNDEAAYKANHAVSIIGWDDNYSRENFLEASRPSNNGAWIVRNSWGERMDYSLLEVQNQIYSTYSELLENYGITSAEEIPNEIVEMFGFTVENDIAYLKIGDNGLWYVSYEDCNVSKTMNGIIKATDTVNYENIYNYDELSPDAYHISYKIPDAILCNVFDKKTNGAEYITQVGLSVVQTAKCKVYINPNGDGKTKDEMKFVQLKAGDSETLESGYHTLEFEKPVEITGNKFTVAIEVEAVNSDVMYLSLEARSDAMEEYNMAKVETNKCFISTTNNFETAQWIDLGKINTINSSLLSGDSSIKAFTVSELVDGSLNKIEITNPPNKTEYVEGEDFDKSGMVVEATYNRSANKTVEISDYTITDGNNLKLGQTSVTISFEGQTTTQPITVTENPVESISITKEPTKTTYLVGQNFDKTGMVVTATYANGLEKEVEDYTIVNGTNLQLDQTSVTIKYGEKTAEQPIVVEDKSVKEISINEMPTKTKYIQNEENLDLKGGSIKAVYTDNSNEIVDLTSTLVKTSGFSNKNLGKNTITVEYASKKTTFDVEIVGSEKAVNSNLDGASCQVNGVKYYKYTDPDEEEYLLMDVTVKGLAINDSNDSNKYYYYLSPNANASNITGWVEIEETQEASDKLEFEINTKDISNYEDLASASNVYLYIKEIATKGTNQSTKITKGLKMTYNSNVETYLDDKKITSSSSSSTTASSTTSTSATTKNSNSATKQDETVSKEILPKTGAKAILLVVFIASVVGIVIYIRYKNLSKYVK